MPTTKIKDLQPFEILALFGQSLDRYRHSTRLARLFLEIRFKISAVCYAHELIVKQEETLQSKYTNGFNIVSYEEETRQLAYLSYFFDAVYALTEKLSEVTRIFHRGELGRGFNKQRKKLIRDHSINTDLAELMTKLDWYVLLREVRRESSHWGTSILAYGYNKVPKAGSSQIIIEKAPRGEISEVLTQERYNFDVKKTFEIIEGLLKFLQEWSIILIKKLDKNVSLDRSGEITLEKFLEKSSNVRVEFH